MLIFGLCHVKQAFKILRCPHVKVCNRPKLMTEYIIILCVSIDSLKIEFKAYDAMHACSGIASVWQSMALTTPIFTRLLDKINFLLSLCEQC